MNTLKALVILNTKITPKILNWTIETVAQTEDALGILQHRNYSVVAISEAIPETEKLKIEAVAPLFNPNVSVVRFNGEADLENNIKQAFRTKKKAALQHNFLDNAFEMELACKLNLN
ncbi:MAG: hypothetical protein ACK5NB_01150 [Flavobacteriaceae bacterium]